MAIYAGDEETKEREIIEDEDVDSIPKPAADFADACLPRYLIE